MFELSIRTDNAAFHDDDGGEDEGDNSACRAECARILREIAARLEQGSDGGPIMDANGNRVGRWNLT